MTNPVKRFLDTATRRRLVKTSTHAFLYHLSDLIPDLRNYTDVCFFHAWTFRVTELDPGTKLVDWNVDFNTI